MPRYPRECLQLIRNAVKCRECFLLGEVQAPFIDVAQPRSIGPRYWTSSPRVVVLMLNPGQSGADDGARRFLTNIRLFRSGRMDIREIFEGQREVMRLWGNPPGRFCAFYIDRLGLSLDEIAFANVAWCGTEENRYPKAMLRRCFEAHTGPLLKLLSPDIVIASGVPTHRFAERIRLLVPSVSVIETLHYAHRTGRTAERREVRRVRAALAKARGRANRAG